MKLILVLVTLYYFVKCSYSYCYWSDHCHYIHFSSKTPYEFVRGDFRDSVQKEGCETISVWGLIRHGKRNPDKHFVRNMLDAIVIKDYIITNYKNGKSLMCAQDIENLYNWEIDQEIMTNAHHLVTEGYQDMAGIGYRLSQVFKDLLKEIDESSYTIRPAFGHWVENGAKAFAKGLGNESMIIEVSNPKYDIMVPYEACEYYMKEVKKNASLHVEQFKFENLTEYLEVRARIEKRTGINFTITSDNMTSLYDLCRYTTSGINNTMSPWCALFTNEDLAVLEYIGDLRHYYRNGYGTHINQFFGSIPMADLLENFEMVKNGRGKKFVVYFSHATMMDMVFTALGLFRDEVPLSALFRDPERKWRTSINSPFASNLVASLNRCTVGKHVDYNVKFYLNERPLKEMCNDGVCSWQEFEQKLQNLNKTSFDFCKI